MPSIASGTAYAIGVGVVWLDLGPEELLAHIRERLTARSPLNADLAGLHRAAVLVPLLFGGPEPHLLFTQRSDQVPTHKGQISFPGGAIEDIDDGPETAALRETAEEIGILPAQVQLLGRLDDVITHTSGFVITPFVGTVPHGAAVLTSDVEVASILEIPLASLLDPVHRQPDARTGSWQYLWEDVVIWGATARILTGFLSILSL